MNECILVVDDDPEIVRAIAILLEKEGYQVLKAYNGMEALEQAVNPALRLIVIDVMMPRLDGLSAVMKIREKRNLPIIVLSAKSEDSDKVLGLSMGADDYIAKPFHPQELVARVRSQLRRYTQLGDVNAQSQGGEIVNGRLCYRPEERVLLVDGEPVKLTATELKIVDLLMRNLGRVFPAEEIVPTGMERGGLCHREHRHGTHTAHPRKNRAQSKGTGISEGGVGHWIQNREALSPPWPFWPSFWASRCWSTAQRRL